MTIPNIMSITDMQGNLLVNKTTPAIYRLTAARGSLPIKITWNSTVYYKDLEAFIKVTVPRYGEVTKTTTQIIGRQANAYIYATIFEFSYPANTTTVNNTFRLSWVLSGLDLYYNTDDNPTYEIEFEQLKGNVEETARFNTNSYQDLYSGSYLFPVDYSSGGIALFQINGRDFENGVYLEFEGDAALTSSIQYNVEEIDMVIEKRYIVYLTKYNGNYTRKQRQVKFTVCGKSISTGKIIKYTNNTGMIKYQRPNSGNLDLQINIGQSSFNYKGAILECNIQYTNSYTSDLTLAETPGFATVEWQASIVSEGVTTRYFTLTIEKNETDAAREGKLKFSSKYLGNNANTYFSLYQQAEPNKTLLGSWEDAICSFPAEDTTLFELCSDEDDTVVYKGYGYPVNGTCTVNLHDIINNYIEQDIKFYDVGIVAQRYYKAINYYDNDSCRTFYIKVNGDIYQTFHVVYNWTFNDNCVEELDNSSLWLNRPIQNIIDKRQYLWISKFWFRYGDKLGTTTLEFPYLPTPFRISSGSENYNGKIMHTTSRVPRSPYPETDKVIMTTAKLKFDDNLITTFKICYDGCYSHALYYINKYGGIDWFLFNKVTKETRNITNTAAVLRSRKVNYNKKIKQTWTLHTDLLNDEQSKMMPNLLESNCLYLHDLEADKIVKVNIVDNSYDIKSFRNQGKKLFNYTFKVEADTDKNIY